MSWQKQTKTNKNLTPWVFVPYLVCSPPLKSVLVFYQPLGEKRIRISLFVFRQGFVSTPFVGLSTNPIKNKPHCLVESLFLRVYSFAFLLKAISVLQSLATEFPVVRKLRINKFTCVFLPYPAKPETQLHWIICSLIRLLHINGMLPLFTTILLDAHSVFQRSRQDPPGRVRDTFVSEKCKQTWRHQPLLFCRHLLWRGWEALGLKMNFHNPS